MGERPISLIDEKSAKVAALDVALLGDHFEGSICLDGTPREIRQLFEKYEEIVDGQMFSLLDDVEEKIARMPIRVLFNDGSTRPIWDLQVYPSTQAVSFKMDRVERMGS
jgi:hypothetical protein